MTETIEPHRDYENDPAMQENEVVSLTLDTGEEHTFRAGVSVRENGAVAVSPVPESAAPTEFGRAVNIKTKSARNGEYIWSLSSVKTTHGSYIAELGPVDVVRVNSEKYRTLDEFAGSGGGKQ